MAASGLRPEVAETATAFCNGKVTVTKHSMLIALLAVLACSLVDAKPTRGYLKKDGTYVQPHEKTAPNKSKDDNYSTKGNENPYTGKKGSKPRDGEAPPKRP